MNSAYNSSSDNGELPPIWVEIHHKTESLLRELTEISKFLNFFLCWILYFILSFFSEKKSKEKDLLKLNARRLMDFSENKETSSQINELSMIASRVQRLKKINLNFRMIKSNNLLYIFEYNFFPLEETQRSLRKFKQNGCYSFRRSKQ
jgi:hypothetical protein